METIHRVPDNDDLAVSNFGDVWANGKLLNQFKSGNGYTVVHYKYKTYTVHRLVAKAFHGIENQNLDVNHKDGNKQNNYENNLEWVTRSENLLHAYRNGLVSQKNTKRTSLHKAVIGVNLEGRMFLYHSITIARNETGAKNIGPVLKGRRSKSGNYNWMYFKGEI